MPNTYTTREGVTLSRDAFICHYVAAFMAAHCSIDPYGRPHPHRLNAANEAARSAVEAWEQIEKATYE